MDTRGGSDPDAGREGKGREGKGQGGKAKSCLLHSPEIVDAQHDVGLLKNGYIDVHFAHLG